MQKVLALMIPIIALMIPIVAMYLKHVRVMAGVESADGKKGHTGAQARTLAVLTETLERQHERLKDLQGRVESLETILTDEQRTALLAAEPAREPATAPVRPRPQVELPAPETMTTEEAVVQRNRDRA